MVLLTNLLLRNLKGTVLALNINKHLRFTNGINDVLILF